MAQQQQGTLDPNGHVVVPITDVDSESDTDIDCTARDQIKSLLWIEGSKRHKKALEYWSAQDTLCTRRVDSKRKQSLAVKNEVYQVIGFYSVFQGVLLTAVSQSNLLHCNNWWSAFSLSALASLVAFFGIIQKFRTIQKLERTIASEKESRKLFVSRGQNLLKHGPKFKFHQHALDGVKSGGRNFELGASFAAVIVMLILFAGTFLATIHRVLCNPGHSLLPPSP